MISFFLILIEAKLSNRGLAIAAVPIGLLLALTARGVSQAQARSRLNVALASNHQSVPCVVTDTDFDITVDCPPVVGTAVLKPASFATTPRVGNQVKVYYWPPNPKVRTARLPTRGWVAHELQSHVLSLLLFVAVMIAPWCLSPCFHMLTHLRSVRRGRFMTGTLDRIAPYYGSIVSYEIRYDLSGEEGWTRFESPPEPGVKVGSEVEIVMTGNQRGFRSSFKNVEFVSSSS